MHYSYICVLGKGHSGSTILSLLLGQHPNIVALGEVKTTLDNIKTTENLCSCGNKKSDCCIWSKVLEFDENMNLTEKYIQLSKIVKRQYNENTIIADSSKSINNLSLIERTYLFADFFFIFLLKDIRNYVASMIDLNKNFNGRKIISPIDIAKYSFSWLHGNRKTKKFLDNNGLDYIQLGYEELVMNKDLILNELSKILSIEWSNDNFRLDKKSTTHIIHGNALRHDPEKNSQLKYDYRWLFNEKIRRNLFIIYPFLKWNNRNVYNYKNLAYKHNTPEKYKSKESDIG